MKRFRKFGKRFLSVALVAMSVFAVAMPASAASVYGINMTLKDGLYCRTQPNATAPTLGTYDNGAQITVLDTSGDWWQTKWTSSQNGYVSKDLVVVPGNIVSINGTSVNVRSTASTQGSVVANPQNGAMFSVVDVTTQWVKIQVNSATTGWVRWDYLKKAGNGTVGQIKVGSFDGYTNGVKPLYSSVYATTIVGYTNSGASFTVFPVSNSPGWLSTSSGSYIQGILVLTNTSVSPGLKAVKTTQQISLYESYNSTGPSVTVNANVTVIILDTTVDNWIRVGTPSGTGWIKSNTLSY